MARLTGDIAIDLKYRVYCPRHKAGKYMIKYFVPEGEQHGLFCPRCDLPMRVERNTEFD